jgi:S1-C subfamily serine protease
VFQAPAATPAVDDVAEVVPVKAPDKPATPSRSPSRAGKEEEIQSTRGRVPPRPKAPLPKAAARLAPRDERAPIAKGKSSAGIIIGVGAAALLLVLGCAGAGTAWWIYSRKVADEKLAEAQRLDQLDAEKRAEAIRRDDAAKHADAEKEAADKEAAKKKADGDGAKPPPADGDEPAVPGQIPPKRLAALKAATVFVKCQWGRLHGSGSGFLVKVEGDTGYVVTNRHVISPPRNVRLQPIVNLVFWSGTKSERVVPAQIVAADPDERRDLAVLKVTNFPDLPTPLNLEEKVELVETMTVWILGFPFGEVLSTTKGNPAITIGKGAVSSIPRNDQGELAEVRISGALNPGNSGGPVVDGKGRLVGVAVKAILGANIGFAIPPAELSGMLNGRVSQIVCRTLKVDNNGSADVQVETRLIDPMDRLKAVSIYVHSAENPKGKLQPGADGRFALQPGGRKIDLILGRQEARATFKVTSTAKAVTTYSYQTAYVTGEGKTIYTQMLQFRVDFSKVGEVAVQPPPNTGPPPKTVAFAVDPKLAGNWSKVYLTEMQEYDYQKGPWDFGKGHLGDPNRSPIKVKGNQSPRGIGMHPNASIKYKLGKKAKVFKTGFAFQDNQNQAAGATLFIVKGDGKQLWKSQPLRSRGPVEEMSVDVAGVDVLELRTELVKEGEGFGSHAVWIEPYLLRDGKAGPAEPPPVIAKLPLGEKEKVTVKLPAIVADMVVGGDGRYLVLHLPKFRKMAIFDVHQAKVTKYIPLAEDHVKFAAGMTKLMIGLPSSKVLQRWDLKTGEKDKSVPVPIQEEVKQMLMGSASEGPLVLNKSFVDIETLKVMTVKTDKASIPCSDGDRVRASADGKVFGRWTPAISPQSCVTIELVGGALQQYGMGDPSCGHVCPGPDGKVIFTARGLFTLQGKGIGETGHPKGAYMLGACHGDYYLELRNNNNQYTVKAHRLCEEQFSAELEGLEIAPGINGWDREEFGHDKRIIFIPREKLIITLPAGEDRLVLHRFDPDLALEKSGLDYLYVTSEAPTTVKKGDSLSYQVTAKSKKGGVKYKLEFGPDGMKVAADGKVTWKVPADFADNEVPVCVNVTDSSGRERLHTFTLIVK